MAARKVADKGLGPALHGITARLSQPFATRQISVDHRRGQHGERQPRVRQPFAQLAGRINDGDRSINVMASARQQRKASTGCGFILGLGQDASPGAHHRIGRQYHAAGMPVGNGKGLCTRQADGVGTGHLVLQRGFVERRRVDRVGDDPESRQQINAARRSRGKHEAHRPRPSVRDKDGPGPPRHGM